MSEVHQQKSSIGKIIGCGCAAIVLLGIIGGATAFFGFTKLMKSNNPYKDSITAVQNNPAAVAALGEPIKEGLMPTGNISTTNGEGSVDLQIGVSGPKGKGKIYVKGSKASGSSSWNYDTWELKVDGQEQAIPLK
ncbi:MAG: cytochrome c oxidase assembly factor 1 family protein [Verrucomicrobiales bacterium]|nr:cytochrome c oxidase assembly factor 1 family protein [Verrucomicrobiales bacterium]